MVRSVPVMRIQLAAVVLVASLPALPLPARAQEAGAWWTQRLTYGAGPMLIENLWCKGPHGAEFVFEGHPIVTLVDERRYVMPTRSRARRRHRSEPASIALERSARAPSGARPTS